jgi:hypothetical protein
MKFTAKYDPKNVNAEGKPMYYDVYIKGNGVVNKIPVFEKDGEISVDNPTRMYEKDGKKYYADVVKLVDKKAVAAKVAEIILTNGKGFHRRQEPKNGNIGIAYVECEYSLKLTVGRREDGSLWVNIPKYTDTNNAEHFYAWPYDEGVTLPEVVAEIIANVESVAEPYKKEAAGE